MKKIYTLVLAVLFTCTIQAQEWESVSTVIEDFRTDHTFGFSIDGVVFRPNFYSYAADTDTWTRKADFPGGARGFGIGYTYEGKAYFGFGASGSGERMDDLWVYDPAEDTWTELASCECVARTHPAMTILNGVLYVTMGGGPNGNLNDHWAYDIATNTWSQKAAFPAAPRHHPFQFVVGDYVYAGFGHGANFISNEWYRYDPSNDTWEQLGTLQAEGRVAGTQFSFEGKGYVLSGDGDDHNSMTTGEFWEYDPENDTWIQLPAHPDWSRWAPASFMIDGWVYLIGGWSANVNGTGAGYPTTNWKYPLNPESVSTSDVKVTDIQITPNPAQEFITLPADILNQSNISIYDNTGKLMLTQVINTKSVDISDLNEGMYFLEIVDTDGNQYQSKFLKQ